MNSIQYLNKLRCPASKQISKVTRSFSGLNHACKTQQNRLFSTTGPKLQVLSDKEVVEKVKKIMSNSKDNDSILSELKPLDQAGKIEVLQSLIVNGYEKFEELVKLLNFDQNSPDVIGLQLQYFTYKLIAIHGTGGKFDYTDLVQSWQKQYVKLMEFELTLNSFHFDLIIKALDKLCILSKDAKYYQLIINHFKIQLERGGSIGDFNKHFHSLINTLVNLKLDKDLHITYLNELNSLMHI
ncbi:hypothetical protein CONCODRAFT_10635, partial [Conidiobolus coronatus NRRL 28638]